MTDTHVRQPRKRSISIYTKLLSNFLIIAIIPLLILGLLGIRLSTAPLREFALAPLQRHVLSLSNHIRTELYDVREDVLYASRLPDLARMLEYYPSADDTYRISLKEPVYNDFIELVRKRKKYHYISYIDETGKELVRVNFMEPDTWYVIAGERLQTKNDSVFFEKALKSRLGNLYVSDITLNEENGILQEPYTRVMYISTPVEDISGHKRGVLTIALRTDVLFKPLQFWKVERYPSAIHFAINKKGFYIAHSTKEKEWGTQQNIEMKWSVINDFSNTVSGLLLENEQDTVIDADDGVLVTHRVYPEPNNRDEYWIVASYVPRSIIYARINSFKMIFFALLAITIITTIIVAMILSAQFTRPIKTLRNGAAVIRGGNLSHRIDIKSTDEVEELAYDLNLMTEQLEELYQNLENKVKERTQMLQQAMADLEEKDKLLQESDRLKLDFLTNLSSELRTPLTSIMGYISLLINNVYGDLNDKQLAALNKARKNVYHTFKWLDGIIRISSLSAIQNDAISIHKTRFNLAESISLAIKNLSYAVVGEQKSAIVRFDENQVAELYTDKEKVDEIISSLLSGIVYHQVTQDTPIHVEVKSEHKDGNDVYLVDFSLKFANKIDAGDLYRALIEPFIHSPTFFNITNLSTNVARSLLTWLDGDLKVTYDKQTNNLHAVIYLKKDGDPDVS